MLCLQELLDNQTPPPFRGGVKQSLTAEFKHLESELFLVSFVSDTPLLQLFFVSKQVFAFPPSLFLLLLRENISELLRPVYPLDCLHHCPTSHELCGC